MSCKILVSLNDSPLSSQCSDNHSKRNISPSCFSLIRLIRRAVFFRRSNLLKIFMATTVVLFILFLLLKASPSKQDNQELQEQSERITSENDVDRLKHVTTNLSGDDLKNIPPTSATGSQKRFESIDQNDQSMLVNRNKNLLNFTYSLSMNHFLHMKNINVMQVRIKEAMKHSWDNYRRYAWGHDMLKPRSREPDHWFNLGLTIVDSVDTLIMMGLENDAYLAIDWIEDELKFNSSNENSNCFELTIRVLAGILTAFHLTSREKLKSQAIEMGDILLHCYDTGSRSVPYSDIDLSSRRAHPPSWNPHSSLSEVSSLQLEFRYLSQISGKDEYEQTTFQTSLHLHNLTKSRQHKLLPMYINPTTGQLEDSLITLGARSDSYYEYLLKQYLQTGIKWLENDYLDSIDEISSRMLRHTNGAGNYTYAAEMQIYRTTNDTEEVKYYNKMDHLVCFLPGTLALGYYHFSPLAVEYRLKYNLETPIQKINSRYDNHLKMAEALARTCYHMYSSMGTGLSPEIANFIHFQTDYDPLVQNQPEIQVQSSSAHNILRPEFVESLFYLYHITGLPKYREQASNIFEAFQKYSRVPSGYSPISDVREKPAHDSDINELLHKHAPDRMESFWLSETLKYLYLIFCDDKHIIGILLNNYIFNTEAHILPIV